jgi:hypothetical protein
MREQRTYTHALGTGLLLSVLTLGAAGTLEGAAIQATEEIPEEYLLDVAIEILDPGVPDPASVRPKKAGEIFPDLRQSEARYIPMRLKETLESTGHWGAVRVVPAGTSSLELTVTGEIRESSGLDMVLKIRAFDASGKEWLEKKYKTQANHLAYSSHEFEEQDPYQAIYDQIANDLLAAKERLDAEELVELRQISQLRFAATLSPTLYKDYLRVNTNGTSYKLKRLPAEGDPMMMRVASIRERDYMLVDVLNEYYGQFVLSMREPYDNWRSFSFEEEVALAELRRQARARKILGAVAIFGALISDGNSTAERAARDAALIGGMAAIQSGIAKGQEAKIHREAIGELSASFDAEVAPLVVEVEGETVRLTGSREEQYATWRQLLRRIYAAELGLPADPNTATDLVVEKSTDS